MLKRYGIIIGKVVGYTNNRQKKWSWKLMYHSDELPTEEQVRERIIEAGGERGYVNDYSTNPFRKAFPLGKGNTVRL